MQQPIKSFVLRAGRVSPRQQLGLEEYLADYQLPEPLKPWDLATAFGREAPVIVEIGFGMGASLYEMAKRQPEVNFIGVEVHRAGIGALAAQLHEGGVGNVRIAPYDAMEVFRTALPNDSLAGIQIFFPDPWPKKRHQKRRLIQSPFIHLLVVKLKKGGFIHCATDWEDYALQMQSVLSLEPALKNQHEEGGFSPRPASRPLTKFEQRGHRLGHGVWDLIFTRRS